MKIIIFHIKKRNLYLPALSFVGSISSIGSTAKLSISLSIKMMSNLFMYKGDLRIGRSATELSVVPTGIVSIKRNSMSENADKSN